MPPKKYHITLECDEREHLEKLSRSLKAAAIKVQRAKAMLSMDSSAQGPGLSDSEAVKIGGLSV